METGFLVPNQMDNKELADLRRVNADLTRSLSRCREIVSDCRSKLAANGNDVEPDEDHKRLNAG